MLLAPYQMYGLQMFSPSCVPLCFTLSFLCYTQALWFASDPLIFISFLFVLFLPALVVLHSQNYCPHTVLRFSHVSSIFTVSALYLSLLSMYIDFYI